MPSEPITPAELAEWTATCEAATPGEWSEIGGASNRDADSFARRCGPVGLPVVYAYGRNREENIAFIALAHNEWPRLIARVRELEKRLESAWRNEVNPSQRGDPKR